MKTIRKFAYAAVLSLGILSIQPTLAAAEGPHGSFNISHEVRCHNVALSPGDYNFSITRTVGGERLLVLQGINGTGTDAMLLVNEVDTPKPDETNSLVLVSRDGQSYVSAMELPEFDMVLRFDVPSK
jgi:hypothetical protein